ncbi:hypothetical protein MKX01_023075 [Papaver californicum]|nr:hypothetical protein MKX01_023075 [Papaver californicum]
MEENEVEEGEAYNYYQEENDESNIDPDVHLSYIDEKIEVCLGHLKKDFEGGVSADNLGPKFGGYGSFLPSYQRSPIALSHPRTPQKIQNYNAPKSPNNLQSEDALENAKVASSVTHIMGLGPDCSAVSAEQHPVYRAPAVNLLSNRGMCLSQSTREFTSADKPVLFNPNEKKTLKVRIKVGTGRILARTNTEIYSGLGLDISPSSSLDESATESGGLSLESHDTLDESPMSMIQIMTSFPVPGGVLLSPLSDSLLLLTKKEKLMGDSRCGLSYKNSQESSAPCVDESSKRGDRKVYTEKRKLVEKKSVEMSNKNVSDAGKGSSFLKKEIDAVNSVPCNGMQVSVVSKSKGVTDDLFQNSGRQSGGLNKRAIKEEFVSGISKKEMFKPIAGHSVDSVGKQNLKISMPDKFLKGRKVTLLQGDPIEPKKFQKRTDGEIQDLCRDKIDASKGREDLDVGGLVDSSTRKTSAAKHGIKVTLARRKSSDEGNLKFNGIIGKDVPAEELPKRISKVASSSGKDKTNKTGEYPSMSKIEKKRLHKDPGKPRERSTDLCEDTKVELPENRIDLLETPRYKAFDSVLHVAEKENPMITDNAKERSNGTRKVENQLTSEAYTKVNPIVTPLTGNEPVSDVVPAVDPLLIEQWVGCDKCSKWRLLPYGADPESLPKKWQCDMLNWLPGMNQCDFSEDETTTALNALYLLPPVPVNQNVNSLLHEAVAPGVTLAGQHMNLTHDGGFNVGKKKLQKGALKAYQKDISNSTNNSLKASLKSRNLQDVIQSPLESDPANFMQSNDVKHPRVNRKRGEDQDELKASKKRKSFGCNNGHWINDHRRQAAEICPNSMNVIPNDIIAKDAKCDSKDRTTDSIKNSKGQVVVPVKDGGIAGKKRKVKEWQKSQIYPPESYPSTVLHFNDNSFFVEETNESEQRKEKKVRVSKPVGKESSLSKGVDKTAKRGRGTRILLSSSKNSLTLETKEGIGGYHHKEHQLGQYVGESTASPRSLDGMEILKKDIEEIQNAVAPASSSSKVSGPRKTRFDIHEVKGSPVVSVSSSPSRISNPVKVIRARGKLMAKGDATTIEFSAMGSSALRCSDNELDGGNVETETMEGVIPRSSMVSSGLHHQDRDANHPLDGESKPQTLPSASNADNRNLVYSNHYNSIGSKMKKSSKESLQSNDKIRSSKSAHGECDAKVFSPYTEQEQEQQQEQYQKKNLRFQVGMVPQNLSYNEEPRIEKSSFVEKCAVETSKVEKNRSSKKDPIRNPPSEGKIDHRPKFGGNEDSSEVILSGINSKAEKCRPKQTAVQFHESDEAPSKFASERLTNHLGISTGKEKPLPFSGDKEELLAQSNQPIAGKLSISGSDTVVNTLGNTSKISESPVKLETHSKTHSRQSTTCGYLAKDLNATQIPVKKDPSSQAAVNAIKEAKDLKHTADRLMKLGQELESAEIYFQACLKFLRGSSLLEHCNTESTKRGDMNYMIEMYSSTAKLWDYVAHAYEKLNVMAAAALAYKCTEVAYMKVIYSKNLIVHKDRHELQEALKLVPPGESPSSSSSGVDNLNNQVTLDKVALAKADGSQITTNHVIVAQNHPKFVRVLNFAENVNNAMEASRKSQNALALVAANAGAEVMSSVKSVIDFTFHDIDGLLHLVRLAMETISR